MLRLALTSTGSAPAIIKHYQWGFWIIIQWRIQSYRNHNYQKVPQSRLEFLPDYLPRVTQPILHIPAFSFTAKASPATCPDPEQMLRFLDSIPTLNLCWLTLMKTRWLLCGRALCLSIKVLGKATRQKILKLFSQVSTLAGKFKETPLLFKPAWSHFRYPALQLHGCSVLQLQRWCLWKRGFLARSVLVADSVAL